MEQGELVAVWLHDDAAKLFLGLHDHEPVSRWVVVGTAGGEEPGIGIWIDVKYVEERRAIGEDKAKRVGYRVNPSRCMIRWDYVIAVQILQDAAEPPDDPRPVPGQYL